jgi:hypothetical protein
VDVLAAFLPLLHTRMKGELQRALEQREKKMVKIELEPRSFQWEFGITLSTFLS